MTPTTQAGATSADETKTQQPYRYLGLAEKIANSPEVLSIFAAPEWGELSEDGKLWVAGIVRAALASPAVVPESVRRERARQIVDGIIYDRMAVAQHYRHRLIDAVANLIADVPPSGRAAEGGEDDKHRCGICDEPLIEGQMVLTDVELGEVHADCCGPERDSYVKNVETGEPLGPNDTIPAGRPYVAPTPPASAGDVDGDLTALAEAASVAERAYGIL